MPTGDEILVWKKEIEEMPLGEITECPFDWWPLNINSKGEKSCPICRRIWK